MAGISASRTRLSYITETAWGTTPASPAFKNLRMTSESLVAEKTTVVSQEIRPDRNVPDLIQVGRMANGSVEVEMSYGSFDDLLASAFYSDWATNVLKNGVTQKSFMFEKTFDRNVGNDEFHRFAGCVVNTAQISVSAGQLVTGSFGIMGKGVSRGTAALAGATYANANTEDIMSGAADLGSLTVSGLGASPLIQSIQINTTNNLRQQAVVGSVDSAGIAEGRFEVSGNMTIYFDDGALFDTFLNNTAASLSFLLGTAATKRYLIEIPKMKIQTMPINAGGNDQDIMANIAFQALYDSTLQATAKITRAQ